MAPRHQSEGCMTQPREVAQIQCHPGDIPFLIGVTGHRDISEWCLDAVRLSVREVLLALREDLGNVPGCILSSLAAGADQLVAEEALKLKFGVHALLPYASCHIEADDPQAQAVMRTILDHPNTQVTDLSSFAQLESALEAAAGDNQSRLQELHYEQAGLVIARHSHLMLAVVHPDYVAQLTPRARYRPDPNAPTGGVRRILEFWVAGRLEGGAVGISALAPQSPPLRPVLTGPLLHIATARDKKNRADHPAAVQPGRINAVLPWYGQFDDVIDEDKKVLRFMRRFFGDGSAIVNLVQRGNTGVPSSASGLKSRRPGSLIDHLAEFNRRVRMMSGTADQKCQYSVRRSVADLQVSLNDICTNGASADLASLLKRQQHLFAGADAIANTYGEKLKSADLRILVLVPVSVLLWELFAEIGETWLLGAYILAFAMGFSVFLRIWWQELQNWYQDCRLIGEAARVQFFWSLAGLPYSTADEHQASELGEESWLYAAIKAISLQGMLLAQRMRLGDFVLQRWIGTPTGSTHALHEFSYRRWYPAAAKRDEKRYRYFGRIRGLTFAIGYSIAVGVVTWLWGASLGWFDKSESAEWIRKILIVSIPTLPAIGAMCLLWRERRAYEVHVAEYRRMNLVVIEGLRLLAEQGASPGLQATVLQAIGREALREASRWLFAHRSRPVGPVTSG